MADLTFYKSKRNTDEAFALEKVNEYLTDYNNRQCCANCEAIINFHLNDVDEPYKKKKIEHIHKIIQSMMFSSGFFCLYKMTKERNGYDVSVLIKKMTPEEKVDHLYIPMAMD